MACMRSKPQKSGKYRAWFIDYTGALFHRDIKSIKRAVDRQEFPPPSRFLCRNVWTVRTIIRHIEDAIERASREVQEASLKITKLATQGR